MSHCFEEIELTLPYTYFALYGAQVEVLAPWWVPGQARLIESNSNHQVGPLTRHRLYRSCRVNSSVQVCYLVSVYLASGLTFIRFRFPETWVARTRNFKEAQDVDYDAVVVPGGVWSSTVVRNDGDAIALVQSQYKKGKLLATTCSGSTVLINAGLASGIDLTGSPSIAIDLSNAGARYQDVPTVTVGNIVSGRSPGGKDNQLWIEAMAAYLSTH